MVRLRARPQDMQEAAPGAPEPLEVRLGQPFGEALDAH
jgi:hypothetical protein